MKKRADYFYKLITRLKAWAAEITLQDAIAEGEAIVKTSHRFIEKLRY